MPKRESIADLVTALSNKDYLPQPFQSALAGVQQGANTREAMAKARAAAAGVLPSSAVSGVANDVGIDLSGQPEVGSDLATSLVQFSRAKQVEAQKAALEGARIQLENYQKQQQRDLDSRKLDANLIPPNNIGLPAGQDAAVGEVFKTKPEQIVASDAAVKAKQADATLKGLINNGFSMTNGVTNSRFWPEFLKGQDTKQFQQAKAEFASAVTGKDLTNITPQELSLAEQQYFPQPGDHKEVLAQKEKARATAIAGLQAKARNQVAAPAAAPAQDSSVHQNAVAWAQANPTDPRAQRISRAASSHIGQ